MQILDDYFNIRLIKIDLPIDLGLDILRLTGSVTSNRASNQGGYQGEPHWNRRSEYHWMSPVIKSIEQAIHIGEPSVRLFRIWFNINGPGHSNRWHKHSKDEIVSVAYVNADSLSGAIEFRDGGKTFSYAPIPGDLLIFDGSVEHRVLENNSNIQRISIACNFKKQ